MSGALEDEAGDIIGKARTGLGLSIAELSSRCEISQDRLARVEACKEVPTPAEIDSLCSALGLERLKLAAIAERTWTPRPPPEWIGESVATVRGSIGGYPVNGYILFDPASREAACVDTAYDAKKMLKAVGDLKLKIKFILLTHAHRDHVGGVETIRKQTGASVILHRDEAPLFSQQVSIRPDSLVSEGTELTLGTGRIRVIATPGHTRGGACYLSHKACFVGDALFAGSTGRSMSPSGFQDLLSSLRQKILSLPEDTILFPGHGPATTVGEERLHNPFF